MGGAIPKNRQTTYRGLLLLRVLLLVRGLLLDASLQGRSMVFAVLGIDLSVTLKSMCCPLARRSLGNKHKLRKLSGATNQEQIAPFMTGLP